MGIGLDVTCIRCGNLFVKRRKGTNQFCTKRCSLLYRNKYNNPSKSISVKQKISNAQKGRWSGSKNPNYGGEQSRQLWQDGKYDQRNFSGSNNPAWIDGRSFEDHKRGSNWKPQKLLALKRDNFQCQKCGRIKDIVVHHKIPYAISEDNSLENLQTLCRSCHGKEHMVIGWNYFSKRIGENKCREV